MARHPDRLKKRGSIWWTWFYVPEVQSNGSVRKRKIECSTGQRDRALAREAARRLEHEYIAHVEGPEALGLADVIARYLAHLEAVGRAPDTLSFYTKKAKHLLRILGADTDVHSLGPMHADAYLARRRSEERPAAANTVAKELGTLRSALVWAKHRQLYTGTPDWCVPPELRGAYTPRERALTHEEYGKLLAELKPRRRGITDRQDYLVAFVGLGVRDSELYRILPDDWVAGRVHIRGKKGRRDRADRWLTPPKEVVKILDRRKKGRAAHAPLFPRWGNVRRDLAVACEAAEIVVVTPNDLRRTFCTWLAEAGVPELVTASLMGHANSAMIRKVYARIGTAAQVNAIAKMPSLDAKNH